MWALFMKLEVLQENLAHALSLCSRVLSTRPQIPILSHFLLLATQTGLEITASNSETTIVVTIGAKIDATGSFTVPGRTFQDLVASLPPGKILLELLDSQLKVKSANFTGKVNGTPASEFPSLTATQESKCIWQIDAAIFQDAVTKTVFSCATDESRAILTGVLFKRLDSGGLTLVATDGFRLSQIILNDLKIPEVDLGTVVIPAKTILELTRIFSEKMEDKKPPLLNISFLVNGQVLFVVGDIKIYSRIISGNFPNFEKIIPSESSIQITTSPEELSKAVKIASVFARESANIVRLTLDDSKLLISANAAQVGENETDIDVEVNKGSGQALQIAFNYRYILDFLNSLTKTSKITLDFTTALAAGVFHSQSDSNFLHLIMPVRVQT